MKAELSPKLINAASAQLVQYASLLHMNNCELQTYVQNQLIENPILESAQSAQSAPDRFVWHGSRVQSANERAYDGEKDVSEWFPDKAKEETLYDHVHEQLLGSRHSEKIVEVVEYLAQCLNDSGYLEESCAAIADRLALDEATVKDGLAVLRTLSPAGIGARDLCDCLLLQLDRLRDVPEYAADIIKFHLNDLAAGKYKIISQKLGASMQEVYEACRFVKSLDPRPATQFISGEKASYIIPDAIIINTPESFEIALNDSWIPSLTISPYYMELMKTGDPEVKDYLAEKYSQARIAIHNIEQRKNTLILCIKQIVETQKEFFYDKQASLVPMSQNELASKLAMNESTLSRAIHGKYILCSHGVYALSYFFSRSAFSVGNESKSQAFISSKIKNIIDSENPKSPLSDQKIVQIMQADGIDIARRTVAKYRAELNIPTASERKARSLCVCPADSDKR